MLLTAVLLLGSALAQSHTFVHNGIEVALPGLVVPSPRDALVDIDAVEVVLSARPLHGYLQKRAPPPGPLFGDSGLPSANDPRQNNSVNSCGLSAAMIAVAFTLPRVLQANLHYDSSSTYASADRVEVDVTDYETSPPVMQRKTVLKSSLNSTNMMASAVWWPGAFEKAIEQIPQNTTWRSAGPGMKMITGLQDDLRFLEPSRQRGAAGREELFADMLKAERTPILLQTLNETRRGDVLVVNHVYAVLRAYMNGTMWAHLKDPLGPELRLPLDTFWPQLYLYNFLAGYPTQEDIDAGAVQRQGQGPAGTGSPRATVYTTPTSASAPPAISGSPAAVLAYEGESDTRAAPADTTGSPTGAGRAPPATRPAITGARADEQDCEEEENDETGGAPATTRRRPMGTGSRTTQAQAAPTRTGSAPGADVGEDCGEDDDDEGERESGDNGATRSAARPQTTAATPTRPPAVNAGPTGASPGAGAHSACDDDDEDTPNTGGASQAQPQPAPRPQTTTAPRPVNVAPTSTGASPGADAGENADADAECDGDGEDDDTGGAPPTRTPTGAAVVPSSSVAVPTRPQPGNAEATGVSPGADVDDGCDDDEEPEEVDGDAVASTRSAGVDTGQTSAPRPTAAASPGNQEADNDAEDCDGGDKTTRDGSATSQASATATTTAAGTTTPVVNANEAGATASARPAGPGSGSAESSQDENLDEDEGEDNETTIVREQTTTVMATTTDAVSYAPTNPAFSLPASSAAQVPAPDPTPMPVITNEELVSAAESDLGPNLGLDASTLQALGEWLREHLPQLLQKLRDQKPQSDRW